MIYIASLFNEGELKQHMKKHWGKYALLGGGLAAAALGREIEDVGSRRAAKAFANKENSEDVAELTKKTGRTLQKYGYASAGGGAALGVKSEIDRERKERKKK